MSIQQTFKALGDPTRREILERLSHDGLARRINCVNLKNILGQVEADRGSHHGGRFLFCGHINNDHTMAHSTPDTGAVHPISLTLNILRLDGASRWWSKRL